MIELEQVAPDLEDLAAYLDGRLSAERRTRVEERLLRDEDYYDVFLESSRFLEQEQRRQDEGGEVVAPAVWWRSWKVIAPLAVAATLVMAVGLPRLIVGPSTGYWVVRLDAKAAIATKDWGTPGWQTSRGGSDPTPIRTDLRRQQELAFRIGSHTVDLKVALRAEDRDAARGPAAQLERRIRDHDLLVVFSRDYEALRDSLDHEEIDALRTRADELETALVVFLKDTPEAERYALGAWNEAGRLAAHTQNAEVLAGIWRRRRMAEGIADIQPQLKKLKQALDQPTPDFETAKTVFGEIARALAGRD